jgi:mannitol/fructose-specific phosphotransferase system IIA component (Ntr-type)
MMLLNVNVTSRQAVFKLAAAHLFVRGRTLNPGIIEAALWEREEAGSTGFGFKFAIPHCRSSAVIADSLMVIKPKVPIVWDSVDDQLVTVVILLATGVNQGRQPHLKTLSVLARNLNQAEFRDRLEKEQHAGQLFALLNRILQRVPPPDSAPLSP